MLSLTGVLWGLLALTILAVISLGIKYRQKIWAQIKGKTPSVSKQTIVSLPFSMWRGLGLIIVLALLVPATVVAYRVVTWVFGVIIFGQPVLGNSTEAPASLDVDRPVQPAVSFEPEALISAFTPDPFSWKSLPESVQLLYMAEKQGENAVQYTRLSTALEDGMLYAGYEECCTRPHNRVWIKGSGGWEVIGPGELHPLQGSDEWLIKAVIHGELPDSPYTVIMRTERKGTYVRIGTFRHIPAGTSVPWGRLPDPNLYTWKVRVRFAYPDAHPSLAGHSLAPEHVRVLPGKIGILTDDGQNMVENLPFAKATRGSQAYEGKMTGGTLAVGAPQLPPEVFTDYPNLPHEVLTEVVLQIERK